MNYNTGNTHLLSAILTKVSGSDTWSFAQNALAAPLGITLAKWPRDPQGVYFGGNDMLLTPRLTETPGILWIAAARLESGNLPISSAVMASTTPGDSRLIVSEVTSD